jgi:NADH-quinone oxidoreductase subunit H
MLLSLLSMIAQAPPTLMEGLIFGEKPSPLVTALYGLAIVAVVFLPLVSLIAMIGIWAERKVAGRIQSRHGPNRVGPFGILQSLADGMKLLLKEDLRPKGSDRFLFLFAPYLAFAPVFAAFLALPFAPDLTFEPRLNAGVFFILAVLSVEVMGVIIAGWASNNKWSVYGAMREACQMVSYEIPLGMAIIIGVMAAGTLNLVELGMIQGGGIHTWIIFRNPFVLLSFFTYFVASLASNKRAPFDLPESESELVAGFHTEYSGLRFSFFFFAEYAAMFVVAGIQVALFLGGWHDPFGLIGYFYHEFVATGNTTGLLIVNLIGAAIFITKAAVIVFVQMWIRWTLPRPRIDQVLYACIQVLLPFVLVVFLGAAVWQLLMPEMYGRPWEQFHPFRFSEWAAAGSGAAFVVQVALAVIGLVGFFAVLGWIGYAWSTGRAIRKRLSEAAPIEEPEIAQ